MLRVLSYIGTVLALIFLGAVLVRGAADLPALDFRSGLLWIGLLGGLVLYGMSQIIGAVGWKAVLLIYGITLPARRAESQLLLSQIGKYIPGNVAHLFGRLSLARADGVAGTIAGAAMLLEIAILLTTGFLIVAGLILTNPDFIAKLTTGLPEKTAFILPVVALSLLFIGLIAGQIFIWRRAGRPLPKVSRFIVPLALHAANFGLLGVSLWCVTLALDPSANVAIWHCIAIFTTAWVAGFLMPGAPGGVGVRDGIIALGLELFIGQGAGLGVAVAHRIVSVLGDALTFGIGLVLRKNS